MGKRVLLYDKREPPEGENPSFVDPSWKSTGGGEKINQRSLLTGNDRITAVVDNRYGEETNPFVKEWSTMKNDVVMSNPLVRYTPLAIVPYSTNVAENFYKGARGILRGDYSYGINQLSRGGLKTSLGLAVEKIPFDKLGKAVSSKIAPQAGAIPSVLKNIGTKLGSKLGMGNHSTVAARKATYRNAEDTAIKEDNQ